jgi:hypothetical protein
MMRPELNWHFLAGAVAAGATVQLPSESPPSEAPCPAMPTPAFAHDQAPHEFPAPEPRHIEINGKPLPYLDRLV